jgi:recombination protein RecA
MRKLKRRKQADDVIAEANGSVRKLKRRKEKTRVEFLSSGSTTLNLSLSGKGRTGGWARGRVDNIVGDGSSGKTICALETAFWTWKNIKKAVSKIYPKVKRLTIVYNNCEGVMDFPLEKMYGKQFVESVGWVCIKTIEGMGRDFAQRLKKMKKGDCLLYIIDSWDSLISEAADKRFDEAVDKDKEMDGSYNLEKQKYASAWFSNITGKLENNALDATLMIISQVRTKIGARFGKKTYRAGGKALDFYTHQVAWIREVEKMKKTKQKQKRVYGIKSAVKVERSKVAKPFRESEFTILYDYGIDDLSSMIDFLWGKSTIRFNGKKFKKRDAFIRYIEKNGLEHELQDLTEKRWQEIEDSFEEDVQKRKSRH